MQIRVLHAFKLMRNLYRGLKNLIGNKKQIQITT